ncbi:MAG: hypothetical protein LKE52_03205 [Bacilli bacterium]|nr:hypothetical protein [Bacilli bacterium]
MELHLDPLLLQSFRTLEDNLGKGLLYLVGGVVRDTLLGQKTKDLDVATPIDPGTVHSAFPSATYFASYGTTTFTDSSKVQVTIASFRREEHYADFRHPSSVVFVKEISSDYKRRDFTINALYADTSLLVLDPTRVGLSDLENRVLRVIGDPGKRLAEDPLRILRGYRFMARYSLVPEEETKKALISQAYLLRKLTPGKIREEIQKAPEDAREEIIRTCSLQFAYER